jgi:hypothetical protein
LDIVELIFFFSFEKVHELVDQNRAAESLAEEREFNDDAHVLASVAHPVEKVSGYIERVNCIS